MFQNLSYILELKFIVNFKILIKVFFKILSMNFAYYFFLFFLGFTERFVVASVLVLDKFCIFILSLSVIFLLTMLKLL